MNYSDYLKQVLQAVVSNIKPGQAYITAAALGTLLRQTSPNVTWKSFGKRSLSELLSDPFFEEHLEQCETSKGALAIAPKNLAAPDTPPKIETFNPLRKAMWEAFVLERPLGHRFISRVDGSVRLGQEIPPTPADQWVEILPVTDDQQFEWACAFSQDHASQMESVVDRQGWTPHTFSLMLKKHHEPLASRWNRYRSTQVSKIVQEWLTIHSLPLEFAFQRAETLATKLKPANSSPLPYYPELSAEETKQILLSALSSLPLEELLDIRLPPRLIFEALSKSKAS